ncbi:PREDICTED: putative fasciclin arabinogalactan [Prunus dulcis]|uniref:PREDICTED: putative fasciclin arabinogalactan n=1 Tax=Prunus dulcis TaxID=3755 RepID=A0A5E4ERV2_PRUDU|nr:hypothetical protein L3X38_001875 [Prunus dulcis]VVA18146.1 PREDICTED: putative fasciclin arabinogalactan [Prunus dulcis]
MASKFAISCFLLLLASSTLFITIQGAQPYQQIHQPKSSAINLGWVSAVLSHKGYRAMALTLETVLEPLIRTQFINQSTTLTLFCPHDQAFFNSKYPQPPPLTLLKYHIVPFKIDPHTMEASFHLGSKVETLLPGHPLVVTSLPGTGASYPSLNQVKVTDWVIFNNGRLIVHGVENFFDPEYDVVIAKEVPSSGFSDF